MARPKKKTGKGRTPDYKRRALIALVSKRARESGKPKYMILDEIGLPVSTYNYFKRELRQ